jgi:hypothetical protein
LPGPIRRTEGWRLIFGIKGVALPSGADPQIAHYFRKSVQSLSKLGSENVGRFWLGFISPMPATTSSVSPEFKIKQVCNGLMSVPDGFVPSSTETAKLVPEEKEAPSPTGGSDRLYQGIFNAQIFHGPKLQLARINRSVGS